MYPIHTYIFLNFTLYINTNFKLTYLLLEVLFIKNNMKNNQIIAFLILIPMLIFTLYVTIKSENVEVVDKTRQKSITTEEVINK